MEAQYVCEAALDPGRRGRIVDADGEAPGDAEVFLHFTQRQQADIGEMALPSERAMIGLPATGDRRGRGGVACVAAGMVSRNGGVQGMQPNPAADQEVAPCPPNLMNFPSKVVPVMFPQNKKGHLPNLLFPANFTPVEILIRFFLLIGN